MSSKLLPGFPESAEVAKAQAKRLTIAIAPHAQIAHGQALEVVAKIHGERSWGAMTAHFSNRSAEGPDGYDLGLPYLDLGAPPPDENIKGWKSEELELLVQLLRTHPKIGPSLKYRKGLDDIIDATCMVVGWVDTILDAVSPQLGDFAFALKGKRLLELFGISTQNYYWRPNELSDSAHGFEAVSVGGAAILLMQLELLGLDTHPEHLVSVVNRQAAGRKNLTEEELQCNWYRMKKGAAGRQRLMTGTDFEDTEAKGEVFSTATGYTCTAYRDARGRTEIVTVDPPRRRTSAAA